MLKRLFILISLFPAIVFASDATDTALRIAMAEPSDASEAGGASYLWHQLSPKKLKLKSKAVIVADRFGNEVYAKRGDEPRPVASITKLMTAMVILDSPVSLQEPITITKEDRDLVRLTGSRLKYGATLTREQLVRLALMSSENRAASALARTFPGGREVFIREMNRKAKDLGMNHSRFADPAGLEAGNVASARDLVRLVEAARQYPLIREATTTRTTRVHPYRDRGPLKYNNTNRLLKSDVWDIGLSKTGYINESGRCLVMWADIMGEPMVIVLLDSFGKLTPFGDSNRIRKWIERSVKG